jgi:general stress protein YciG
MICEALLDEEMMAIQDGESSSDEDGRSAGSPPSKPKSTRGFASMDPAKQREIARKGGRAAHEKGTAHEFTSDEARAAGRKGGEAVSRDRRHMAEIGREGGQARGQRVARRKTETPGKDSGGDTSSNDADTTPEK